MAGNNNLTNTHKKTSYQQTTSNNGILEIPEDYKVVASSSKSFDDGWNQVEKRENNTGSNNKGIKIGEMRLPSNTMNENHSNIFNQLQVNEECEGIEIAQGNKATHSQKIHEGQSKVPVGMSRWEKAQVERKTRNHNHQQGKLNVRSSRHFPESKSKQVEAQIQSEIENMVNINKEKVLSLTRGKRKFGNKITIPTSTKLEGEVQQVSSNR
ncbi:hypothetical protein KY290_013954 [Solanum tuberosum]|uniref:Uncharacterized protein n=1 Tax=Solanum tuberosum TaxID=4113 RepID=A0ABQ7VNI5_SOLTU|nr:hypothetical protein KY290_013954 [Solanum tuberosum]